jgi:predicted transcriptional regulator
MLDVEEEGATSVASMARRLAEKEAQIRELQKIVDELHSSRPDLYAIVKAHIEHERQATEGKNEKILRLLRSKDAAITRLEQELKACASEGYTAGTVLKHGDNEQRCGPLSFVHADHICTVREDYKGKN